MAEQGFDVVIVGARCAGSPLATMLARRGLRVCAVDRASFPSETPSTHVIQPIGVEVLRRLGVLDELWERGAAPLEQVTITAGKAVLRTAFLESQFGAPGMCVRRVTLDDVLVQAGIKAGVDLRTETNVTGLLRVGERVVGVETSRGPITASLVVGADGHRSRVAELVGAREYAVVPAARLFAWGYFRGVAPDTHIQLRRADTYAYLAAPADDDLYLVAVVPSLELKPAFVADRDAAYAAGIAAWPELALKLDGAHREGPVRVMSSWHSFFREAAGPGWALVGDAGQFKDPTPGQGISDALRQTERLAEAIAPNVHDAVALEKSVHAWWRWRDRDAREMHWFAADLGTAGPMPPLREHVVATLGTTDKDTLRFLRVLNHEIKPSKVFTARKLARAVVAVGRSGQVPKRDIAREAAGLMRDAVTQARLTPPKRNGVRSSRRSVALREFVSEKAAAIASRN